MKYCVKKNTTVVVDGSENPQEAMIQNAINAGFTESEVETLTEEEYLARKASEPIPIDQQIIALKAELTETDYKIIKCAEYQLAGLELPYNIVTLNADRQAIRNQINLHELSVD